MKILLFTATGAENLGDELITLCEIRQLKSIYPSSSITIFSHDIMRTTRFLQSQNPTLENIAIQEYFPNYLRKKPFRNIKLLWETLKTIKSTDHVYIGGGGLLYSRDEEGHSPIRLWWMRAILIKILRKPLTYLSLGMSAKIDELKPFSKWLFQWTTITVRDEKSREVLSHLWYKATILYDPVLAYIPWRWDESKIIGIALRRGFLDDSVITELVRKLTRIWYEILLLPHSLHPGDALSHDGYYLQNFLLPGVMTTQTIEQTLEWYRKCHMIISMRLHSMILAIDHHAPFIGISYGQKTQELLKELDWKYSYQHDVTEEALLAAISEIESNYINLQKTLSEKHTYFQQKYTSLFPWI